MREAVGFLLAVSASAICLGFGVVLGAKLALKWTGGANVTVTVQHINAEAPDAP